MKGKKEGRNNRQVKTKRKMKEKKGQIKKEVGKGGNNGKSKEKKEYEDKRK